MKKLTVLLTALIIGGMMFTSCKKTDPEPTPGTNTKTVEYSIPTTLAGNTMSPGLYFNIKYTGADGNPVSLENVAAPWSQSITVVPPFEAKCEVEVVLNQDELPDKVSFCQFLAIKCGNLDIFNKYHLDSTKEKLINLSIEHPEKMRYSKTLSIQ